MILLNILISPGTRLIIKSISSLVILLFLLACSDTPDLEYLSSNDTILAFGDSLTHGTGVSKAESYPAILEKLSGRKVINAGVPGEISEKGLKRLPGLLDAHKPSLLILCHGGNDILRKKDRQSMAANVRNMIQLAQARNIPVILLGVPQFGLFLSSAEVYEEIADSMDVVFMEDLIPDILGDNSLKSDMVHPNSAGYQVMAEGIHSMLQKTGAL